MRRSILLALALAPAVAGAQGLGDANLRLAPQFVGYSFTQSGEKVTINELAVPIAVWIPLASHLNFDVGTSYANASVKSTSGGASETHTLSGLTDTQIRLNYTLGGDAVVVTLGANLPTGQYKVPDDKVAAAGAIGNDFFAFPVSSFGNGFAGTGGVAVAQAFGAWNFALGASFRKSAEFGAFGSDAAEVKFTPADEMRLRLGTDHAIGSGRMMLGLVYSAYGKDETSLGTTQATATSSGARTIGQAAFDIPMGTSRLYIGGWYLHHASGEIVGSTPGTVTTAGAENVGNATIALGFNAGALFLEPSIEGRIWTVDANQPGGGSIGYLGLRTRFGAGALEISPSAAFGVGILKSTPSNAILTGFKGGITIRIGQ